MSGPRHLARKLRIKPGLRAAVLNAPAGLRPTLTRSLAGCEWTDRPSGSLDWVLLFVRNATELGFLSPAALAATRPGGDFWIAFPNPAEHAGAVLDRDSLWEAMRSLGQRPVAHIAVDGKWSALRFRAEDRTTDA